MTNSIFKRYISMALVVLFIFTLLCYGMLPQHTALAASHTVNHGDTFDIGASCADGDTVTVAAGATATITGSKNVTISCEAGVTLTLSDVTSDVSGTSGACALTFTGSGNTLILSGENTLRSGYYEPGVRVESDTELVIKGQSDDASLTATGGAYGAGIGGGSFRPGGTITIESGTVTAESVRYGAGIGGGYNGAGGTITIEGGTVNATGGQDGAGIGGGHNGDGDTITIKSGTVTAKGGNCAPGIGGGHNRDGGTITISGGTVKATGAISGAGIGGGMSGAGGTITIEGGTVNATSGCYGAGIGGGNAGEGGTITISGGTVYAANWSDGKDIGPGSSSSGGTFTILGDALIFLKNDSCLDPVTATHAHIPISESLDGFSLPSGWTDAGIYAEGYVITYNDNGGTGGTSVPVPKDRTAEIESGSSLSNPGYTFKEWNTEANGNGTSYTPGSSITMTGPVTLYAIWEANDSSMISSVTPSGSGAALDGGIAITFANDMNEATAGTVSLGGTALTGGSWSNNGRSYTIAYSGLSYYQTYTIDISGFKDTYGTAMDSASYSFTTEAPAELISLSVGTGALDQPFDADTVVYTVNATGINSIGITAETEDPDATLTINGVSATSGTEATVNLNNGANLIPVVVTSQDGVQKSYIISVNGTVSNADLSSLTLSEGTLSFDKNTTDYYVTVGSDVTSIDLTASADDSKAVMLLDGAILSQGGTETILLAVGDNTVNLMVIAQDATTKTYTVTINRGSSDASLSNLTLSEGTLSPSFNPATDTYTAVVANSVSSLTVTPTTSDNAATVTVNGAAAATPVNLTVGSNTITIEVTGSDGVTTKEYTITVTRQAEITITNASLPVSIVDGFYSVTMAATGGDDAFTWSATGLPSSNNLSIDSATGVLSGTPADGDEGSYAVTITATDGNGVTGDKSYTLVVQKGCGGGAYLIVSDGDPAYTGSYTDDGIPTLTVNDGVSGFTYFGVDITPVTGHTGNEICVFVQTRNGEQIGFSFNRADYDAVNYSGVGFNVQAGDVIKVFIVDTLSNGSGSAPTVL